MLPVAAHAITQ
uniref:Uncharacterized protein n=1 Tax=Anguilla anguilla TaxID=7936 RepID=A0A0E9S9K6_ANGAN